MKSALVVLAGILSFSVQAAEDSRLKLIPTISLPGVKGRFDHFAIDASIPPGPMG